MNISNKLLAALVLICTFNLMVLINIEKKLKNVEKAVAEYFAPLPDYDVQGEPEDGRAK